MDDITIPLTKEQIQTMTADECRVRLAKMTAAANRGDYNWSYDEYLWLRQRIPEERAAEERAWRAHEKAARRR